MDSNTPTPTPTPTSVLIVDDNRIVLELARDALEAEGYVVETTDDPLACEALLDRLQPDALVLDIAMPKLDGLSLLRLIQSHRRHACAVVLYSERPRAELSAVVRMSGADGGVSKSGDFGELVAVLGSVLRTHRTSRTPELHG